MSPESPPSDADATAPERLRLHLCALENCTALEEGAGFWAPFPLSSAPRSAGKAERPDAATRPDMVCLASAFVS